MVAPRVVSSVFDIDFLFEMETKPNATIDLRSVESIEPVGIVAILAAIERRSRMEEDTDLTLVPPLSSEVRQYMLQTGMFEAMREFAKFTGVQPEETIPLKQQLHPMVQCSHFKTDQDIEDITNEMTLEFQDGLIGTHSTLEPDCCLFLGELASNVVYHAQSDGGYVLAQMETDHEGRSTIEIAVADCGIGIRTSLRENPLYATLETDWEALRRSIEEGVSRFQDNHRGYGLHEVLRTVRKRPNRTMKIRSGQYTLYVEPGIEVESLSFQTRPYKGTIVQVSIPC